MVTCSRVYPGLSVANCAEHKVQYGAGAASIAKDWGVLPGVVKQFISNYYKRYPEVEEWQKNNIREVEASAYLPQGYTRTKLGMPAKVSKLKTETGRVYSFVEGDAPKFLRERGILTSFTPTEIKNYPNQGGATGDIVPMVLGKMARWLISLDCTAKMINTVHDSIMVDVHHKDLYNILYGVEEVMAAAPKHYEEAFGIRYTAPLFVDVSFGRNWRDSTYSLQQVKDGKIKITDTGIEEV